MFMPDRGVKTYLTGNEKRQQHLRYVSLSSAQHPLDRGAIPLRECQKDDAFLADIRKTEREKKFRVPDGK